MKNEKEPLEANYEIVIKPKTGWFDVNLKEIWQYRDLVSLFVKRNFVTMYKQTILGPLWLILNPLLTSVVFTFVFGQFAGISTDGVPQFLFYMAGNTMWGLFNASVVGTANTFVLNNQVFSKVYFPRLTAPISQGITSLVNFAIQFVMLIIFYIYFLITGANLTVSLYLLVVPVLILQCACLGLGVGIIVSSVTTKYRDLAVAVGFGMQLWMYATPVVYPVSSTGGFMHTLLLLNPMTPVIENFRFAMLGCGQFLVWPWVASLIVTVVILLAGIVMFSHVEKTFVDTI